jgi:hypothetical protein
MNKRKIVGLLAFLIITAVSISNAALNNVSADTLNKWITTGTTFGKVSVPGPASAGSFSPHASTGHKDFTQFPGLRKERRMP